MPSKMHSNGAGGTGIRGLTVLAQFHSVAFEKTTAQSCTSNVHVEWRSSFTYLYIIEGAYHNTIVA